MYGMMGMFKEKDAEALALLQAPATARGEKEREEESSPLGLWVASRTGSRGTEKVLGVFKSLELANAAAKKAWTEFGGLDSVEVSQNTVGCPYSAFACIGMGQDSVTIDVRAAQSFDLSVTELRTVCAKLGISKGAKKSMQVAINQHQVEERKKSVRRQEEEAADESDAQKRQKK